MVRRRIRPVDFQGAHAVVTGGSSGIGLATARLLADRGVRVSLLARGGARLEAAADELRARGATVHTEVADVADQAALSMALKKLVDSAGPCDILVSCAGLARPGRFLELPDEVFRQMMEVDYFGTLYALRLVLPGMVERGAWSPSPRPLGCSASTATAPTARPSSPSGA